MEGTLDITDSDGNLKVFNVEHNDDGRWLNSNNGHPDNIWNGDNSWVFVRPRNLLYFSPDFWESFVFKSCPFQPPSILPISSIFTESAIYFVLSKDLVSHRSIKNIFKVSTFLIPKRTYGIFSSPTKKLAVAKASIISTKSVSTRAPSECLWSLGIIW